MSGALEGIRVLDLSRGVAGPMATMVLSDSGAEVTRIESPDGDAFDAQLGYRAWQRGKRSAVLDLKNATDRRTLLDLAKSADVLVESFAPGVTTRLGIDYATLAALNPRLVYCSITGYGRDNPLSDRPGYDALVAARLGLHFEQRGRVGGVYHSSGGEVPFADFPFNTDGVAGPRHADRDGPLFTGVYWPSIGAAYTAQTAICAALFARTRSGRGQWVETSLLQGALVAGTLAYSWAEKPDAPHFATWINDSRSPKGCFECSDGRWVINWVTNPGFVLGASAGETLTPHPDMSARKDPDRIMPAVEDMLVLDHYYPLMAEAFRRFPADEWSAAGAIAGQCIQKIRSPEESLNDPDFLNDGCIAEIEDPELGTTRQVGLLFNLAKNPTRPRAGIARRGEHTAEVRAEAAAAKAPAASDKAAPPHPLSGITVLDLGLAIAGPYGAQVLADLGANVIKVNATWDWYWHSNAIAMSANRGKRSIALDMRKPEGVALIHKLVERADVLIHNMRMKAVQGKGLDYDTLKKINPRLVYCHTRGFEKGPREPLPGNDQTGSALTGVQWEDGACANGGRPYWSLTTMGDTGNGYLAANAILQALYAREQTGEGQLVDTSIVNAHVFNCSHVIARPDGSGFERPRLDREAFGYAAGYRLYRCRDDYLCIALARPAHWNALFAALGPGGPGADQRFADEAGRAGNDAALSAALAAVFVTRGAREWFGLLDGAGVPCEIADPDYSRNMWKGESFLLERQWLVKLPHPVVGTVGHVGLASDFSETPCVVQRGPLIVGQHTREILAELGIPKAEQQALFENKVVADESCYGYPLGASGG